MSILLETSYDRPLRLLIMSIRIPIGMLSPGPQPAFMVEELRGNTISGMFASPISESAWQKNKSDDSLLAGPMSFSNLP